MNAIRSLAVAALVYGGSLGLTTVTPGKAEAQVVYSNYSVSPYGAYYSNYNVVPAGFGYGNYGVYSPVVPVAPVYSGNPYNWNNWGGNPHWSGYPQWYVNYTRWNNPYRGYGGRRW